MKRGRILLADDHVLILDGFRKVLEPHYEVVEAVRDGRSLVEAALSRKPDLIILDIAMPLLNGIDAARQIRRKLPRVKLLFVTVHASPAYLREALTAGASGYVLKSSAREEILTAVEDVLAGRAYVTPGVVGKDVDLRLWRGAKVLRSIGRLTPREKEILQMVAEGQTAREIGSVLKISVKTVVFHRNNLKQKLGARTIGELTRRAVQEGLL